MLRVRPLRWLCWRSAMRLPFPDLLATRIGRLAAFFLLYVTEGIPLGFTATAMATQMRRQGLGPVAIGALAMGVLPKHERGVANS